MNRAAPGFRTTKSFYVARLFSLAQHLEIHVPHLIENCNPTHAVPGAGENTPAAKA